MSNMDHIPPFLKGWDPIPPNGIVTKKSAKSVVTVRAQHIQAKQIPDDVRLSEMVVKRHLADLLSVELAESGTVVYYKHYDQLMDSDIIVAEVSVVPSGTKMTLVEDQFFSVNGELFTQEDVIKAIKQTYPDRLI